MHLPVRSIFNSRLQSALRRPSFAGNGLPERMRSISFALLGLTAAAGLALVAIFAQPSFPLLAPAPLPAEPSAQESVSSARELPFRHDSAALLTALPAPAHLEHARAQANGGDAASGTAVHGGTDGGTSKGQVDPAEADVPAPVSDPQSSSGNNGGGKAGSGAGGGSVPAPAATPQQPPASPSSPAPADPKPEAIASAPKPEPPPAPGNSSSTAAAEHAGDRGIEASSGTGPPAGTPAGVAAPPESEAAPGNGKGLAKGHFK
jgi:hypothetical protein